MPLKMRPTGLGAGIDKDRPDYTVYCGGWAVGRIHQQRGGPVLPPHRPSLGLTDYGLLALRALAPEVYETAARAPVAPVVRAPQGARSPSEGADAQRKSNFPMLM
jgi:hypothetical protein